MELKRGEQPEAEKAPENGAVPENREKELQADERRFMAELSSLKRETERAAADRLLGDARNFTGSLKTEAAEGLREYLEAASRSADAATAEAAKATLVRLELGNL